MSNDTTDKTITIVQLYPDDMNIYGDWGNVLTIKKRLEWHGYTPQIINYNVGDVFPDACDIIIGGGGQDSGQSKVKEDLLGRADTIHRLVEEKVPTLVVCGLYQLFGRFFKTTAGEKIQGISLFDAETHAGPTRLIGNIVTNSDMFGDIVGYENHSGQTFLGADAQAFGSVQIGAGNNGQDDTEGIRLHNAIGTYLHGSLLPKNPRVADFLIEQAVINKFGSFKPSIIDDHFADEARAVALRRPR